MYHHLKLLPAHLTQYSQPQLGVQLLQQHNAPDPQWISYIYIYMHIHMHAYIYIFPSLPSGEEQLVKGKLSLGPLVLWCLWGYGLVCAVPCLLNLALLPRILQCTPKCLQ